MKGLRGYPNRPGRDILRGVPALDSQGFSWQHTKRKRRTAAEVQAIRDVAYEELALGHPMTLRQVHYRLVSRQDTTYRNTQSDYNQLSKWLVRDRLSGVIPWEWIEDRLRKPHRVPAWEDLDAFKEVIRRSYRRDIWQDQPRYLEAWVEKDALSGIFADALAPYGVTFNVGRGFDSATSVKGAADRYGDGAGVTVLYFGDFDPSGEDMVRSFRERLLELGSEPEIIKCALTFEDIERYSLPPDFTKATDTRSAAFVERYGDVAVELDALPRNVLRRERLTDEVETRMDPEALEHTRGAERADRERLDELLEG
jgi:hypothetical protein